MLDAQHTYTHCHLHKWMSLLRVCLCKTEIVVDTRWGTPSTRLERWKGQQDIAILIESIVTPVSPSSSRCHPNTPGVSHFYLHSITCQINNSSPGHIYTQTQTNIDVTTKTKSHDWAKAWPGMESSRTSNLITLDSVEMIILSCFFIFNTAYNSTHYARHILSL